MGLKLLNTLLSTSALLLLSALPARAVTIGAVPSAVSQNYDLSQCSGVIYGAGQSSAVRSANATAMNTCLAAANSANLLARFSCTTPTLEIQGGATITVNGTPFKAGLLVPSGSKGLVGCQGVGSKATTISQWDADYPVIEFGGDPHTQTGLAGAYIASLDVGMGVSGTTNSRCFLFGRIFYSTIENLNCDQFAGGGSSQHPNIGWDYIVDSANYEFNNIYNSNNVGAGQVNFFKKSINGTGSIYNDFYFGGGSPSSRTTLSGPAVQLENSFQGEWIRTNAEWFVSNKAFFINNIPAQSFIGVHIEGWDSSGFAPAAFTVSASQATIQGLETYDWGNTSALGVTGTPRIFFTFGQSQITATGVDARFNTSGGGTFGITNIPWMLYEADPFGSLPTSSPNVTVADFHTQGASSGGNFSLDTTLPIATFGNVTDFGAYLYNRGRSTTEGAKINVANAAFTLYGVHRNAFVNYTGAVSANRAATISQYLAPSGSGNNVYRSINDIPTLSRDGTATGAFNVQFARGIDSGLIGTALTAASTAYTLDPLLIQDLNNNNVIALGDADATIYALGAGFRPITPTIARTITLSPNYSSGMAVAVPQGSCITVPVTAGAAGTAIVNGITLLANTSARFCTNNATGTFVRVQ